MTEQTYAFQLGDYTATVISDFSNVISFQDMIVNADEALLEQAMGEFGLATEDVIDYNCLLLQVGQQHLLVDVGWGSRLENKGRLLAGLQSLGLAPSDIDVVTVTHWDRDHITGLLDAQGRPAFPKARHVIWEGAWDFWSAPTDAEQWPPEIVSFIQGTMAGIGEQTEVVPAGQEFLPGVRLLAATGHRRDHAVVEIRSGDELLLVLGDGVVHPLAMVRRDWYTNYDSYPEEALSTKQRLLDRAAADRAMVFGFHFPFPGLGYVEQTPAGWRWLPL